MSAPATTAATTTGTRPSASTASPLPRRATVVLLAWLVAWFVVVSGVIVAYVRLAPAGRSAAAVLLALAVPVQALGTLGLIHRGLHRAGTGWVALGFTRPTVRLLHLLWQVPVLLVAVGLVQLLMTDLVGRTPSNLSGMTYVVDHVGPATTIALLVGLVVLTPLGEEAFFRGVLYGGLRRRWPVAAAAPVSAACFAVAHVQPTVLPSIFVIGLALALLREFHGTLWASVLVHATINALAGIALLSLALR